MWFLLLCTALIYWFLVRPLNYWKNHGVPQPAFWTYDTLPLLGNMRDVLFQKKDIAEYSAYFYRMFPNVSYYGIYQFLKPKLVIRDPELIRKITVKDFDYFVDHVSVTDPEVDPLFAKNLISLKGDQWRKMRSTLTSSFSSSKMKIMFNLISESSEKFIEHFRKKDGGICEIEVKDAFSRFTIDVIASTSFGIEVDSMKNPNNEFFILGKEITELNVTMLLKVLVYQCSPSLYRFFNASMFRKEVNDFFRNLINETIRTREKQGTYRPDMIQILMEAQKGIGKDESSKTTDVGFAVVEEHHEQTKTPSDTITTDDITAQALIFFFAGFDSVSSLLTFTAYELAINETVQEKLREEIQKTFEECDGKLTYEAVVNMTYMDMVLTESLRKWPPFVILGRECTKSYIIESSSPNGKSLNVPKGTAINVPVYAIHHDPQYYADPEKFNPERFSPENRKKLTPYTFLAFGQGPRACLGSRFALLEVKILLFHLLQKFRIVPTRKTEIPVRLSKKFTINIRPKEGLWLGLKEL